MFSALWLVITWPFRLVGMLVAAVGRAVGLVLGFSLMVGGVAFWAGSWLIVGIPLFVLGLLVTLKSLN
jgi:hypothetical protein